MDEKFDDLCVQLQGTPIHTVQLIFCNAVKTGNSDLIESMIYINDEYIDKGLTEMITPMIGEVQNTVDLAFLVDWAEDISNPATILKRFRERNVPQFVLDFLRTFPDWQIQTYYHEIAHELVQWISDPSVRLTTETKLDTLHTHYREIVTNVTPDNIRKAFVYSTQIQLKAK